MNRIAPSALVVAMVTVVGLASGTVARAESAAEFYRGKEISIFVAGSATGPMNTVVRAIAPFLEKHIPGNPTIVIQHMGGAGGLKAANYVYNAAPKDGTAIGYFLRGIALNQAVGAKNVRYDARKFNWIGSVEPVSSVVALWSKAPATTLEGAKKTEVVMGSTGITSQTNQTPVLLNALIGTKFKVVTGYKGAGDVYLAIERGEAHGAQMSWTGVKANKPDWISERMIVPVAQTGLRKMKDLPNVPRLYDLAENDEQRALFEFYALPDALGRVLATTPGVPADRVAALREGFNKATQDPEYAKEATKRNIAVDPVDAKEVEEIVRKTIEVKPAILAKLKTILGENIGGE